MLSIKGCKSVSGSKVGQVTVTAFLLLQLGSDKQNVSNVLAQAFSHQGANTSISDQEYHSTNIVFVTVGQTLYFLCTERHTPSAEGSQHQEFTSVVKQLDAASHYSWTVD